MPEGIGRPYNKDVRAFAKAKKKLRDSTQNKSIVDQDKAAGFGVSGKRGSVMGLSEPSDEALYSSRALGRDIDASSAKERTKYAK
jgi:hypothetical protein